MAEKDWTHDEVLSTFSYSSDDGILRWNMPSNRRIKACARAGSLRKDGYLEVEFRGVRVRVHRLVWFYVFGEWPQHDIDHINGVRDDNRICNLRDVTRSVNIQNQRASKGASGFLGVSWMKNDKRWQAKITVNGICKHIGLYLTAEDAHAAYLNAKRQLHPGCTI